MSDKKKKSWEKRLKGKTDEGAIKFVESLSYDKRLYKYDILGSIAQAKMLAKQKLITADEASQIEKGLDQIKEQIEAGKFKFDVELEDIHMAIEASLIEKIGQAGKKLHTGRSRNDQVSTDMRLWMRDEISDIQQKIKGLQKSLVSKAEIYSKDIMPCYTHLQRAQPMVIGGYLLSFVAQLERDNARFANCCDMLNVSPLGSGAIAGSTLELDRDFAAKELGFAEISINSIDSSSDRDFCAEFVFDCAMTAVHLSRLAEDWIIYASSEFDFIKIADAYCTSSSMMPQKRNPDMLELLRGKPAGIIGNLVSMLTVLKGLPSGYNRDLQEDKVYVFGSADALGASLDIISRIVDNTQFKTDRIKQGIDAGFADATALAEYLVKKGVAFREAHGIVGELVAVAESQNKTLAQLDIGQFQGKCPAVAEDVFDVLGAANVVKAYKTAGAGGVEQAKEQIDYWKKHLAMG